MSKNIFIKTNDTDPVNKGVWVGGYLGGIVDTGEFEIKLVGGNYTKRLICLFNLVSRTIESTNTASGIGGTSNIYYNVGGITYNAYYISATNTTIISGRANILDTLESGDPGELVLVANKFSTNVDLGDEVSFMLFISNEPLTFESSIATNRVSIDLRKKLTP